MKKVFVLLITIILTSMINKQVSSAQHINRPLTMGDYVLRSCIASVVLIRNHRKNPLPTLNLADNTMISKENFTDQKRVLTHFTTEPVQQELDRHVKDISSMDTPLRTIDIKKGRTRDLTFMKKNNFPEIPPSFYTDDKKQKNAKIIVIKPTNRNNS